MPLFFLGTREWRNRQTRTVQVRVPVMEWGFNSPLAHDETADPFGICGFCFPWLLLAAPWVFRAPRVLCEAGLLAGPGRCVCRWAAARPLAVRAASFARRVGSKPGQAPPPPTGTAADPSGVLYTCGAGSLFGSSTRRLEARPGPATAHGNRSLARLFLWVSWGSRVLSFWGARVRVVTNVVNPRCFSCGFLLRCYERRQSEGFFAEVPVEGLCWASFFAEMLLKGLCWASSFAPIGPAPRSCRRRGARGWLRWGVLQH